MIKNNKGFMLIEVIVTATIVITSMIALYIGFNKLYNSYRIKNSYYNIDAVYATRKMIDVMIKNDNQSNGINSFINKIFPIKTYGYIIENSSCVDTDLVPFNCSAIQKLYDVNNMIFIEYDPETLKKLKDEPLNQTFYDYIDYVINYYNIKKNDDYTYIALTEIQDGDNYYYANLRMR